MNPLAKFYFDFIGISEKKGKSYGWHSLREFLDPPLNATPGLSGHLAFFIMTSVQKCASATTAT